MSRTPADKPPPEIRSALEEMILAETRLDIVDVLTTVLKPADVSELAVALVLLFESRGESARLLEWAIEREVNGKEDPVHLFRSRPVSVQVLVVYAQLAAYDYEENTLRPQALEALRQAPAPFEVFHERLEGGASLQTNQRNLEAACQQAWDIILQTKDRIPIAVHRMYESMCRSVERRFPGEGEPVVGAFFFCRQLVPALLHNGAYSRPDIGVVLRRAGILITMTLQTLGVRTDFGPKSAHMQYLNDWLARNQEELVAYIHFVATMPAGADAPPAAAQAFDVAAIAREFGFTPIGRIATCLAAHQAEFSPAYLRQLSGGGGAGAAAEADANAPVVPADPDRLEALERAVAASLPAVDAPRPAGDPAAPPAERTKCIIM